MSTADTLCMSGIPAPAAKVIGDAIDAVTASQQDSDAQLDDLAANLTATGAELNTLDNVVASVSWAVTAGAANICILTGTIKDAAGATIAAVRNLMVYISEAATGIGVTADSYSTGAALSDGTGAALVANKVFLVQTGTDGVFAISITDTAKPADQYGVAILPNGSMSISAASAALWGA